MSYLVKFIMRKNPDYIDTSVNTAVPTSSVDMNRKSKTKQTLTRQNIEIQPYYHINSTDWPAQIVREDDLTSEEILAILDLCK